MKKIRSIIFCAGLSLFFLSSQTIRATHITGADLSYTYVGPNQYLVTVKLYVNCGDSINPNPALGPPTIDLYYSSVSCGNVGGITCNQVPGTGQEITAGEFSPCYATACNGGTDYGVRQYVYSAPLTLPFGCPDWIISVWFNARTALITTLTSPSILSLQIDASLDNLNYPVNSSPAFSTYSFSRFCINHTFSYNPGVMDPDGDSLVFSLVDALTSNAGVPPVSSPVPYNSPYSGANPVSSNPPVSIDPQTGIITMNPDVMQVGVIAILVQEFRNGVLMGSVRRDMQVNIEAFCNVPPVFQQTIFNNAVLCGDSILRFKLGVPVRCSSVASDGSDFRMHSPSGNPVALIAAVPLHCNASGLTDSIEIRLFAPHLAQNGVYIIFTKIGTDGNTLLNDCGLAMAEYDTALFIMNSCQLNISESAHDPMLIDVYPNPVQDLLSVVIPSPGAKQLEIYNSIGEKIKEFKMMQSPVQLDVSDFSNGFYTLVVSTEMESRSVFFIVRH